MRYNIVLRYIGAVLLVNAVFMLISAVISLFNNMDTALYPLILASVLCAILGAFPMIFVDRSGQLSGKEGYAVVVGSWLACCLVGMFPYLLWGGEFSLYTAWFESVSGFTTTGATALSDVEALPKGLLFWRSCTHLLGGVGVIMFVLIAMPSLGRTKMMLTSAEMSTLAKDNYKYRTNKVIRILLSLYLGLILTQTLLLRVAGMDWFDAVNHSFSTIATGGFSTRNASIGAYNSLAIESIVMFFMALSGVHFGLIFATLARKKENIFSSEVTKYYIGTFVVCGFLIALSLWFTGQYSSFGESLRYAYFHSVSVITTTGFATTDTSVWSSFAILLLIFMSLQCACAGSTSGGIKSDRVWLALKVLRVRFLKQQHPNAVIPIRLNNVIQEYSTISFAMLFIVVYLLSIFVGTMIATASGLDLMTSFSMIASCMGNVGIGFGDVSSVGNYAQMSGLIKAECTLFMLLGRLEIFGFIQIFLLKWWR